MTPRQLARMLQNKHSERSWRKISEQDYFGVIPAGTLAVIAKRDGAYVPSKWASMLGVCKSRTAHHARRLADMSAKALLFAFEHRVEM
jgi:hypothetical protein